MDVQFFNVIFVEKGAKTKISDDARKINRCRCRLICRTLLKYSYFNNIHQISHWVNLYSINTSKAPQRHLICFINRPVNYFFNYLRRSFEVNLQQVTYFLYCNGTKKKKYIEVTFVDAAKHINLIHRLLHVYIYV